MKATKKSWSLTKGVTLNVAATCTLVTFEYNATQLNEKKKYSLLQQPKGGKN